MEYLFWFFFYNSLRVNMDTRKQHPIKSYNNGRQSDVDLTLDVRLNDRTISISVLEESIPTSTSI